MVKTGLLKARRGHERTKAYLLTAHKALRLGEEVCEGHEEDEGEVGEEED